MGVEEVKVVESSIVKPSEETPRHGLWLSSQDLMLAKSGHVPLVYFYQSCAGGDGDVFFDVARLKAALSRALVSFYPLAGRLGVDVDGRLQVDCAEQGVPLLVAHSDHTVDEFSSFKPSPELRRLFVPCVGDSPSVVCAIQVTFLRCGGVALGAALHLRRRQHVPLLSDVVRLLLRRRRLGGGAGAPVPRPHPPPRALPTGRPPQNSVRVLPKARPI
jgi:shikimate O-hydroxycinnamoyltransferase